MKTISLKEAIRLLRSASAVILPDEQGWLVYPNICDEDDFLSLRDDAGRYFHFNKDDNNGEKSDHDSYKSYPKTDGKVLYLINSKGDEMQIQLLIPAKIKFTGEHASI